MSLSHDEGSRHRLNSRRGTAFPVSSDDQGTLAMVAGLLAIPLFVVVIAMHSWRSRHVAPESSTPGDTVFLVNINKASWPEIAALPGIGAIRAQQIVEWRETNGPFSGPDDLERISGIGEATLQLIDPHIQWNAGSSSTPLSRSGRAAGRRP
jgi:competence protein ComEA